MLGQGEVLELDELEAMALSITATANSVPEAISVNPDLIPALTEPLAKHAKNLFGQWICAVVSNRVVGLDYHGEAEIIEGIDATFFTGEFKGIDIRRFENLDPYFSGGYDNGLVPSAVFYPHEVDGVDVGTSVLFPLVGVPLVGTVVSAERLRFWSAPTR